MTIKSYKILQKLSPKHAARGVAQSPYPIYRHGKACLSKQPPWRAAGDPLLARGRSLVRAPGPAVALSAFFLHSPFLPPFFRTFPTKPAKVLGIIILFLTKRQYISLLVMPASSSVCRVTLCIWLASTSINVFTTSKLNSS